MIVLHSDSMNSMPRNSGVSKVRRRSSKRRSGGMGERLERMFDSDNPPNGRGSARGWIVQSAEPAVEEDEEEDHDRADGEQPEREQDAEPRHHRDVQERGGVQPV